MMRTINPISDILTDLEARIDEKSIRMAEIADELDHLQRDIQRLRASKAFMLAVKHNYDGAIKELAAPPMKPKNEITLEAAAEWARYPDAESAHEADTMGPFCSCTMEFGEGRDPKCELHGIVASGRCLVCDQTTELKWVNG